MKKLIVILSSALLISCSQNASKSTPQAADSTATKTNNAVQFYGAKITADSAAPIEELKKMMGDKKQMNTKLVGSVVSVCQKKGCWMKLNAGNGETVRVTFKDYAFFVPKECSGKTAIVEGTASVEETSVAELQEFAKDAGKSKEEIAAIKSPEKELVFEASGVILR